MTLLNAIADRFSDRPFAWDDDVAASLVGKRVLVGVRKVDGSGTVNDERQMHGRVVEARCSSGILVQLEGTEAGRTFRLPPTTGNFDKADPGEYRLATTGEVVVNPDFVATWEIKTPRRSTQ
jgi:hypothetical protein